MSYFFFRCAVYARVLIAINGSTTSGKGKVEARAEASVTNRPWNN
jgi:hypothetical protein